MKGDFTDLRFGAFILALVLYGLFSSPTPDDPGRVEAVIGALLVFAAGPFQAVRYFMPSQRTTGVWQGAGRLLLIYGTGVPFLMALAMGNEAPRMLRDYLALLFLLLPMFLAPLAGAKPQYRDILTGTTVFIGLMFALRTAGPVLGINGYGIWTPAAPEDFLYLTNAPTVLFAALLSIGLAWNALERGALTKSAFFCLIAAAPLVAMATVLQRASAGIVALSLVFLFLVALYRYPGRVLIPLGVACAAFLVMRPELDHLLSVLLAKTQAVGLNMRLDEAAAVLKNLKAGSVYILFGKGWGASFVSPAVGPVSVNYTHCLLTALWFKTGLVGLVLGAFYLAGIGRDILHRFIQRDPVIGLALAGPFLIDVFLYASYKSLDFGLILLLAVIFVPRSGTLQRRGGYCIQN